MNPNRIRALALDEIHLSYPVLDRFCQETKCASYTDEQFMKTWETLIEKKAGVFLACFEPEIIGVVAGMLYPNLYNGQLTLVELFWYVLPEHRNKRTGYRLFKAFENWGKNKGAEKVIVTNQLDCMPEKVERFYKSMGYSPFETVFDKEL